MWFRWPQTAFLVTESGSTSSGALGPCCALHFTDKRPSRPTEATRLCGGANERGFWSEDHESNGRRDCSVHRQVPSSHRWPRRGSCLGSFGRATVVLAMCRSRDLDEEHTAVRTAIPECVPERLPHEALTLEMNWAQQWTRNWTGRPMQLPLRNRARNMRRWRCSPRGGRREWQ